MMSINSKIRRAGEMISDLIQRDTYNLLANEQHENGQSSATKNLYQTDQVNLYGRPTLNLSMKELRTVPRQAFRNRNILILKLNGNYIKVLPLELARLRQLEELYLQNNKLEFLPAQVCGLVNLQVLDFSYNYLTMLPYSIANLRNLRVLDLAYNSIKVLPDSLVFLELLECLDVDGNALKSLPESLCKLSNLIILRARYNMIEHLPKSFTKLKKLREMHLKGNNVSRKMSENLRTFLLRLDKLEIDVDLSVKDISKNDSSGVGCLTAGEKRGSKNDRYSTLSERNRPTEGLTGQVPHDVTEYSEDGDPIYCFKSFAFQNDGLGKEKETML